VNFMRFCWKILYSRTRHIRGLER